MSRGAMGRALVLLAVLGGPLAGQVDDEVVSGVQFNFTPPGARSLGLGGAFLALANDATAAFTNPAGLSNLSQVEISIEGRGFESSTLFTDAGHLFGPATQVGVDTVDGPVLGESDDSSEGLSFLSAVFPAGDFRLALYRHELVSFESSFESSGAFFTDAAQGSCAVQAPGTGCGRLFPVRTAMDLEIENLGLAVAYRFGRLSLGVGANLYRFDIRSRTDRFDIAARDFLAPGGFFGAASFDDANLFASQEQSGEDEELGWNAGVLIELSRHLSIGAAFREGVELDYVYAITCGPSDPAFCRTIPGLASGARDVDATFGLPEVWGVGLAIRPTDTLTLTMDYDRVGYSALVENFTVAATVDSDPAAFFVDDADEWHLGLEYVFANLRNPIVVRLGAWRDPAHQIEYRGGVPAVAAALWAGSSAVEDETHVSGGLGFSIGPDFSIDLAADLSERYDIASVSAVYRF